MTLVTPRSGQPAGSQAKPICTFPEGSTQAWAPMAADHSGWPGSQKQPLLLGAQPPEPAS